MRFNSCQPSAVRMPIIRAPSSARVCSGAPTTSSIGGWLGMVFGMESTALDGDQDAKRGQRHLDSDLHVIRVRGLGGRGVSL